MIAKKTWIFFLLESDGLEFWETKTEGSFDFFRKDKNDFFGEGDDKDANEGLVSREFCCGWFSSSTKSVSVWEMFVSRLSSLISKRKAANLLWSWSE